MIRPSHQGLRHLALNARRLEEMRQFYVDLLGFTVVWEPDPDNVYLSSGSDNLALHRSAGGPPVSSPLDHLGIVVSDAAAVDRWAAFLESRGVTLSARPRTHRDGARSCYLADPDGNSIQIIYLNQPA